jgi:hypothetical protein
VKVRQAGRIVSVAVIIAVTVNTDGRRREEVMLGMLKARYKCDNIYRERYLRDANGKIVKDPRPSTMRGTGEGRRIDFLVVNPNGAVLDAVEVTGMGVDKTKQSAKELAIVNAGGTWIRKPRTKNPHNAKGLVPARIEFLP